RLAPHAGVEQAGTANAPCRKWALAMTASRKGFGKPFLFVFPAAASANMVSINDSNRSAGRSSQRNTSSPAPAFHHLCACPGSTTRTSPARASILLARDLCSERARDDLE